MAVSYFMHILSSRWLQPYVFLSPISLVQYLSTTAVADELAHKPNRERSP